MKRFALGNNWRERLDVEQIARDEFRRAVGYFRDYPEVLDALIAHGPWGEIGAGSGTLAGLVNERAGRQVVVPSDNGSWFMFEQGRWPAPVHKLDAVRAAEIIARHPRMGLLTSWPNYDEPWAGQAAAARLKPGQKLAYIGEGHGGCTADDSFHELLDEKFELLETVEYKPWEGLHDDLTIWRRK